MKKTKTLYIKRSLYLYGRKQSKETCKEEPAPKQEKSEKF